MIVSRINVKHPAATALWKVTLLLVVFSPPALSQSDTLHSRRDSAIVLRPFILGDSLSQIAPSLNSVTGYHQHKSPWLAVGLSAIAPGAGQIYNTNYWKAPLIWGLSGYWIYEWIKLNKKYKDSGDQYSQSILIDPPAGNARYLSNRDFYKDERDKFAWFLGGLYLLNLVDAYVGAHLYDFDVSPDLGLDGRIEPRVTATLRLRF